MELIIGIILLSTLTTILIFKWNKKIIDISSFLFFNIIYGAIFQVLNIVIFELRGHNIKSYLSFINNINQISSYNLAVKFLCMEIAIIILMIFVSRYLFNIFDNNSFFCEFLEDKKTNKKNKVTLSIVVGLFFSCTVFFFAPIMMYMGNVNELWFSLETILPTISKITFFAFLGIVSVCYCLEWKFSAIIISIVFGTGIAFYIEGNFIPMDYGILDGKIIDWSIYKIRILLDYFVWIICLGFPLFLLKKNKNFLKILSFISVILVLVQGIATFTMYINLPNKESYYLTEEGKFSFSEKENVILLIVDCLDKRMFDKFISFEENSSIFKDFTYYSNAMSSFPFTEPSVTFIMTGTPFNNSLPFKEYVNMAYEQTPIIETFSKKNYDIRMFTYESLLPLQNPKLNKHIANASIIKSSENSELIQRIYKFAAMRYLPIDLKKYVWLEYSSFNNIKTNSEKLSIVSNRNVDLNFYNYLKQNGISLTTQNALRVYHFQGGHPPISLDRNLRPLGEDFVQTPSSIIEQALGSVKIVTTFLEELKKNNIYNNATIIITGDHRWNQEPTMGYFDGVALLMKNKNNINDTMKISDVPVVNGDIANTLLALVDEKAKADYLTLNNIDSNLKRQRKYYFYNNYGARDNGYLPPMTEFIIDSKDPWHDNFINTGNVYTKNGIVREIYKEYSLGNIINQENATHIWNPKLGDKTIYGKKNILGIYYENIFFKEQDNLNNNLIYLSGKKSEFGFKILQKVKDDLKLEIEIANATKIPQRLSININGSLVEKELVINSNEFYNISFSIPKGLIKEDGLLNLTILTPDAKILKDRLENLIYYDESVLIKSMVIRNI